MRNLARLPGVTIRAGGPPGIIQMSYRISALESNARTASVA